jgi:hypothetical protein
MGYRQDVGLDQRADHGFGTMEDISYRLQGEAFDHPIWFFPGL